MNEKENKKLNKENKKQTTGYKGSLTQGYDNSICTDPNGSYTGVPRDKSEKPVQDVDDL